MRKSMTPATTCRHCQTRNATRARQLCGRCHGLQAVRRQYALKKKPEPEPELKSVRLHLDEQQMWAVRRAVRNPLPVKLELPCSECGAKVKLSQEQAALCARLRMTDTVCEACEGLAVKGGE